jgi:hypothetical protein
MAILQRGKKVKFVVKFFKIVHNNRNDANKKWRKKKPCWNVDLGWNEARFLCERRKGT